MKKYIMITAIAFALLAFKTTIEKPNTAAAIRDAISKSLPALQASSHVFLTNAISCHSCHNQGIGVVAFAMAEDHGFKGCDSTLREAIDSTGNYWKTISSRQTFAENDDPVAIVMTGNYDLWGLAASGYPASKTINQLAVNIMRKQSYDGRWISPGQRPPLEYYDFTATALTIHNIQVYTPAILRPEVNQRIAKAKEWLLQAVPEANEEKVFQLLGLHWSGTGDAALALLAKKLLAAQHADGGWPQLDSLSSDAYATGQSLYALHECGQLQTTDAAYQKGIAFLLNTQYPDGTWKVHTRSYPFVPYVASGFPHGHDEFISAAGSNWAVIALLLASDKP